MDYNYIVKNIPKPEFKEVLVTKYQSTSDIIADLIFCFKKYKFQGKKIADYYYTGNIKNDSYQIWDFIKNEIEYNAEPFERQTTSSLSRIIYDQIGDCKHSALIVASIGYEMGYNVIIRFASYNKNKVLGHVYVILENPETKQQIIVDPLQEFDYEKSFTKGKDYKALQTQDHMTLTRLTGVGETGTLMPDLAYDEYDERDLSVISAVDEIGARVIVMTPILSDATLDRIEDLQEEADFIMEEEGVQGIDDDDDDDIADDEEYEWVWVEGDNLNGEIGKKGRWKKKRKKKKAKKRAKKAKKKIKRKAKKKVRKVKRKAKIKKFKKAVKKVGGKLKAGIKKIALAPARGAMMALLLLNFKGYATRMVAAYNKNPAAVKSLEKKFGFNSGNLLSKARQGAKKKAMFNGIGEMHEVDGIGIVVSAAAIATAAPVVIALIAMFAKLGMKKVEDKRDMAEAAIELEKETDIETEKELEVALKKAGVSEAGFGAGANKPLLYAAGAGLLLIGTKQMKLW